MLSSTLGTAGCPLSSLERRFLGIYFTEPGVETDLQPTLAQVMGPSPRRRSFLQDVAGGSWFKEAIAAY